MTTRIALLSAIILLGSCSPVDEDQPVVIGSTSEAGSSAVILTELDGTKKIAAIKEVRAMTKLGLADAKNMVENLPVTIRTGLSRDEAKALVDRLKAAGLTAEITDQEPNGSVTK